MIRIGVALIGPDLRMPEVELGQVAALTLEIAIQRFVQCSWRVEIRDLPREIQWMPHVMEPGDLAVGGVKEGNVILAESAVRGGESPRVTLGLREDVLRSDGELLRFHDGHGRIIDVENVVRRTVLGGMLLGAVCVQSG